MNKRVQIRIAGRWEDICPQGVKRNDLFRVFDENNNPVMFPDGNFTQFAGEDAFVDRDGSVTISWVGSIKF